MLYHVLTKGDKLLNTIRQFILVSIKHKFYCISGANMIDCSQEAIMYNNQI